MSQLHSETPIYLFIYLISVYFSGVSVEEEGGERGIPFLAACRAFMYSNLYLSFALQQQEQEARCRRNRKNCNEEK